MLPPDNNNKFINLFYMYKQELNKTRRTIFSGLRDEFYCETFNFCVKLLLECIKKTFFQYRIMYSEIKFD